MAILTFDLAQVKPLAEHAAAAAEHSPTFGQHFDRKFWKEGVGKLSDEEIFARQGEHLDLSKIPAGLLLVKDHGIYLMSNGHPGLMRGDGEGHQVCYAAGHNPDINEDWYDSASHAVGGSDFQEFIDLEWVKLTEEAGRPTLRIKVTTKSISLVTR